MITKKWMKRPIFVSLYCPLHIFRALRSRRLGTCSGFVQANVVRFFGTSKRVINFIQSCQWPPWVFRPINRKFRRLLVEFFSILDKHCDVFTSYHVSKLRQPNYFSMSNKQKIKKKYWKFWRFLDSKHKWWMSSDFLFWFVLWQVVKEKFLKAQSS